MNARPGLPPADPALPTSWEPDARQPDSGTPADPASSAVVERYLFPASFAQQRLWFLEQLDGAGPVWNTRLPVRLQGQLDVVALQAAVDDVVARHESLRTTFGLRDGEVVQSVRSTLTVPVEKVGPAALAERTARAFDLREGPLLRVFLASIAPDDHILLVSSHHIVSDGWSSGVLFRDLAASYDARRCGHAPRLPELPVQYADFAAWQREWLTGPELERQLGFWRRHLEGAPALLELPLDRPRPRLQRYHGHRVSRVLPPELSSGLQALATAGGATLFMVLVAALNVLLSRWSGQQDLVIGTPIAGRRRTELENVVGFFANTLALRTRLGGVATFRELLRNVRADVLRAFDHQDLPFEKLVEALKPVRNLAHSPIFQVLFVLQNVPWEAGRFGDLQVSPAELDPPATARFDLTVTASEYEGRLWLNFEYATDLFEQQTIERLGAGLETLLAALVADPGTALEALPAEADADRRRQLVEWQPAPTPLPAGLDVAGMFEAQRLRTPEAIAVECGDDRLSYRLLDARVVAIARQLVRSGWSAPGPVAICLPRSIDMLATVLAVLRLGGFYLPLDPGLPRARLRYLLEDSGARLLVTTAAQRGEFAGFAGHVLDLATTDGAAADHCALPGRNGDTERPAYLIHTSGSTGRPKGVLVPERAVVNFLSSMAVAPGLAATDRLLAVTTLSFDIAVLELLLPLTVGATVVIATEEEVADPGRLIVLIDAAAITVMQATPSAWRNLLTAGWQGRAGLRLLCGGEALDPALAGRLLECGAGLWNLYGPTETTIWSCIERLDRQSLHEDARSPAHDMTRPPAHDMTRPPAVGRPIANTRCYVLDEHDRPVPIGVSGELWIAGAGVALGYHGLPELTAGRFRPDPFASGDTGSERMYRTGDQARWRNDGRLEILGRMDRQLKLRGYRIEPGEIEAILLAQPAITAAAVILQSVNDDPRLVAYLAPANLHTPVPDTELVGLLGRVLPGWMVPAHFIWLEHLPLTPNGKLDRNALPPFHDSTSGIGAAGHSTGMTADEQALARLFEGLLGRPVGPDDDFFQCGGHSLLATRLMACLRADFRVTLPLRTLFESPTVRTLALAMAAARPVDAPALAMPAPRPADASIFTRAPLSLVQQRLWFLDRLQPGNSLYHLAWAFELRGPLDRTALKSALDGLVMRHGALRTRFPEQDGMAEQCIEPAGEWPLLITSARADAVPDLLTEAATRPFMLATGPLVRALLVETGSGQHTLLLVVHHIVADGWSFGILARELAALYAATGRATSLPPVDATYADYASEQRRRLASGELERQLKWWQANLQDAPPFLDLPTDRPRPLVSSSRGARLSRLLSAGRQAALHELAKAEGCTFFMVVLAAMDVLLARCTGADDIVVGTPIAGRRDRELESLVGFFVNTLVLRTRLAGNPTVRELLHRVRDLTLGAYENADVPFELLVETLQPPRSTQRTPLFQVLFNLHNEPVAALDLPGLEVRPVAVARHTAKFDLSISLAETRGGLAITVEYNRDLFLPASIERFIDDYDVVLAGFVATPDARLGELPFSATGHHVTRAVVSRRDDATTLPAALAEAMARHADARAVRAPAIDGPRGLQPAVDWSYADLAQEVARVAAVLRARQVQPGDRVALWFGHGAGQVAALLGVLEVGAAYVPLDPLAPAARLRQIIADAGAVLVLTDRFAPDWPLSDWPLPDWSLPDRRDRVACLPDPESAVQATLPPPVPQPTAHDPDALAYLLYTSGSTGTPKGVPQTHRNVLHHVRGWARNLGLTASDRLSLLSTYGYDAAVQDIFGALLSGAAACPLDIRRLDRETLLDRIADWGLTVLHATPSAYRYLFGGHVACRQDLSRVRLVVLGGEPARRADFELFEARFAKTAQFVNGYGLTEATAVTQWFAEPGTHPYGQQLPIGRPLHEGAVKLVDEQGNPAAFSGELLLAADALTPGYWSAATQRPEARTEPWFHTGDLARVLPDGNLVFVGRRDERLKIGGIRVEPVEIEMALCSHPDIAEAVVLAGTSPAGDPVLVACCGPRTGAAMPSIAALRAHLAALLPSALIPAHYQSFATLPRLPNGKIDRATLRAGHVALPAPVAAPAGSAPADIRAGTAPVAERERLLVEIWQALLQQEAIGLDDDFFLLGGHSLLATRLVARIRDRLGIELPLIRIFEAPTIRGLARCLYNAD